MRALKGIFLFVFVKKLTVNVVREWPQSQWVMLLYVSMFRCFWNIYFPSFGLHFVWIVVYYIISLLFFPFIHPTPFVFSSCTTPRITTPILPPSPLFLPGLHLIIHHSQIWLNILSWRGWNTLSLPLSLFFSLLRFLSFYDSLSLSLPVCCHGNRL